MPHFMVVLLGSEKVIAGLLLAVAFYWIVQYPLRYGKSILDIRKFFNDKPLKAANGKECSYYVAWTDIIMSSWMMYMSFRKPSLAIMLTVASVAISLGARVISWKTRMPNIGAKLPHIHVSKGLSEWWDVVKWNARADWRDKWSTFYEEEREKESRRRK